MPTSTFEGGAYFPEDVVCRKILPREACITDDMVQSNANIDADKLQHAIRQRVSQAHGTATATRREVIHVCKGSTGVIQSLTVGQVVANAGAATVTVDLRKNGSTVLTGVITLDNGYGAYDVEAATFSDTALVVNDVLEIVVTATAGGGTVGQGFFADLKVYESAN